MLRAINEGRYITLQIRNTSVTILAEEAKILNEEIKKTLDTRTITEKALSYGK